MFFGFLSVLLLLFNVSLLKKLKKGRWGVRTYMSIHKSGKEHCDCIAEGIETDDIVVSKPKAWHWTWRLARSAGKITTTT